jgi:hypothetical protein
MTESIESVQCEVISPAKATIENLQKVTEFLNWLSDLYENDSMELIACDDELSTNFAQIVDIYPVVLSAVHTKNQ